MAVSSNNRVLLPTDILYLATFAAGMAGFWLSGKASRLLPHAPNATLSVVYGLATTAIVYGLGMAIMTFIATRRFGRGLIAATVMAIVLGLGAAQLFLRVVAPLVKTKNDVGLLTFGLYLCYGAIYAIGLAVARKLSRD